MQFFLSFWSSTNISEYSLEPTIHITELFYNRHYNLYYTNIATFFVLGVFPISLLTYYNFKIYKGIKSSNIVIEQDNTKSVRFKQEKSLSTVMIGIVVVFMVCHSLRNILAFYIMTKLDILERCHNAGRLIALPLWCYILYTVNYLLLTINSSINMIVYCCLNSRFRKHLFSKLMPLSSSMCTRGVTSPLPRTKNEDHREDEEGNIEQQM